MGRVRLRFQITNYLNLLANLNKYLSIWGIRKTVLDRNLRGIFRKQHRKYYNWGIFVICCWNYNVWQIAIVALLIVNNYIPGLLKEMIQQYASSILTLSIRTNTCQVSAQKFFWNSIHYTHWEIKWNPLIIIFINLKHLSTFSRREKPST